MICWIANWYWSIFNVSLFSITHFQCANSHLYYAFNFFFRIDHLRGDWKWTLFHMRHNVLIIYIYIYFFFRPTWVLPQVITMRSSWGSFLAANHILLLSWTKKERRTRNQQQIFFTVIIHQRWISSAIDRLVLAVKESRPHQLDHLRQLPLQ